MNTRRGGPAAAEQRRMTAAARQQRIAAAAAKVNFYTFDLLLIYEVHWYYVFNNSSYRSSEVCSLAYIIFITRTHGSDGLFLLGTCLKCVHLMLLNQYYGHTLKFTVPYHDILYCNVLYCTAINFTLMYSIAMYWDVLCCYELYYTVMYSTVVYCTMVPNIQSIVNITCSPLLFFYWICF